MNKSQFKIVLFLSLLIYTQTNVLGQVGIGTISPDVSARLDVKADNMGILIPRVALLGNNDITTIASPATSLLVYNKKEAGSGGNEIQEGFHYFDGTIWQPFTTGSGGGSKWTNDNSNNLIKLTNLSDGSTARTNDNSIRITDDGFIGTGFDYTPKPGARLSISGTDTEPIMAGNRNFPATIHINNTNSAIGEESNILFSSRYDTNNSRVVNASIASMQETIGAGHNYGQSSLIFRTSGNSVSTLNTERMRINGAGNVGIGITNPEEKLDVNGSIQLTSGINPSQKSIITSGSSSSFMVKSHSDYASGKTRIIGSAIGGTGDYYQFRVDDAANNQNYPNYSFILDRNTGMTNSYIKRDNLFFTTAGSYRMNINEIGFVGIGTSNPEEKLHIEAANDSLQIDNLAGTGSVLGIDANGKVTKTTATSVLKVISTSGSHECALTDEVVILNIDPTSNGGLTTGTVNLNANPQNGQFITIKKRDATSNPLTINLTGGYTLEDGATTTITMAVAYQYIKLVFDGSSWVVIGKG